MFVCFLNDCVFLFYVFYWFLKIFVYFMINIDFCYKSKKKEVLIEFKIINLKFCCGSL